MRYAERPPPPDLAAWVHRLWTFESELPGETPDRIVPDGRPELILHFGNPFHEVGARGRAVAQPKAFFAGQVTRPLHLLCPAKAGVVGVRFRPDGAQAFVGGAMRHTTDRRMRLDDIHPGLGSGVADGLARKADGPARLEAAAAFVRERIGELRLREDWVVRECVERIERSAGAVTVPQLLATAGIGRRQLERRFADAVGVGPALLAAIFRFRSVFDVIEHDATRPWTDAAIAAGYYDQSHFIREFRRFVGCTPSEFARNAGALAGELV